MQQSRVKATNTKMIIITAQSMQQSRVNATNTKIIIMIAQGMQHQDNTTIPCKSNKHQDNNYDYSKYMQHCYCPKYATIPGKGNK